MGPVTEAGSALADSMVVCNFSVGWGAGKIIFDFLKAVTGWDMSTEQWMNVNGRRIIQIQRAVLLIGGPDVFWDTDKDDDNPPRWYTPLPSGPFKGSAPKREDVMAERAKTYANMGWDNKGIPTTAGTNKARFGGCRQSHKLSKKLTRALRLGLLKLLNRHEIPQNNAEVALLRDGKRSCRSIWVTSVSIDDP